MSRLHVTIASEHWYPASVGGLASGRVFDCLAKGLVELGHEVTCILSGSLVAPPRGIRLACAVPTDTDLVHLADPRLLPKLDLGSRPWIRTRHVDSSLRGIPRVAEPNTVYVSRSLAETYGSDCYVWNAVDPDEFLYSEEKHDYVLFLCGLERAEAKGFQIAAEAARAAGVRLIAAGSSRQPAVVARFAATCAEFGAEYVGEVWGARRASLLAGARALLFPTQWNESFGLVMVEALVSGTPVIASDRGACPELITPDVGFICRTRDEYVRAIRSAHEIAPAACRQKAVRDFHYRRMAEQYVEKYRLFLRAKQRHPEPRHSEPRP
jgi:glycosyltransferase involved in cell wall biosynthesis